MASTKRKAEPLTANDLKKPKKDASLTSFFGAPKPAAPTNGATTNGTTGASPETTLVKFDKEKWVATLKPDQKSLLKLEIDTLDPSWLAHLKDDLTSSSFLELKRFLQREVQAGKKIFPTLEDVYSWYGVYSPFTCGYDMLIL
jgi:uracil-DNA glycosylase